MLRDNTLSFFSKVFVDFERLVEKIFCLPNILSSIAHGHNKYNVHKERAEGGDITKTEIVMCVDQVHFNQITM